MNRDLTNVKGFIYKITSPNGKIYIGQTINFRNRKYYYKSGNFKKQTKLYNNILFYDWSPIDTIEIIEECLCGENKKYLNEREIFWISYYDSFRSGLNCNEGGEGNLGYSFSDEVKEKMSISKKGVKHPEWRNIQKSEYTKGRKHSDDSKEKMSRVKKERMNDEIKKKISNGLLGNKNGLGNKGNSKKVICLTNNKIYDSIKQVCDELGLHSCGVILNCRGIYKQTKGYEFKYYEEENISI
jgi:group I intron endonuclease